MNLVPSTAAPFNLSLFNSILSSSARREDESEDDDTEENEQRKWRRIEGHRMGREAKAKCDGSVSDEENDETSPQVTSEQHRDGAVHAQHQQQPQQHMDLPAIAMQLLQQAMFRNEGIHHQQQQHQQQKDNEKFSAVPLSSLSVHSDDRSSQQRPSNAVKPNKSGAQSSSAGGSRRAASKGLISAAATAALMAPSPLGALPAIPGALAVAASPAAQLFREDDWSWHRNPAAAIRSGGTNKQTPVWKYFVYNKTENLSRCIVSTCTYQLKGPHTSTLACHLKKHAAEYAEFQRLKSDYTRERMVNGQPSSSSSAGGEHPSSARSTPSVGYPSGGLLPNGTAVGGDRRSPKSRIFGGRFANCAAFGDEQSVQRNLLPRGLQTSNGGNGIFGRQQQQHFHPLGGHAPPHHFAQPPFQHFLIAAAAMAGHNGMQQQQFTSPPPQSDYTLFPQMGTSAPIKSDHLEMNQTMNGFNQLSQCHSHHQLKSDQDIAEGDGKGGTCGGGTGANLLDILNLLSKRAEAAASKEQERRAEDEGKSEGRKRKSTKRKCAVKKDSDRQSEQRTLREDGQSEQRALREDRQSEQRALREDRQSEQRALREDGRKRERLVDGIEEDEEEGTEESQTLSLLAHSVEHILKEEQEQEEELEKKRTKTEHEEQKMNQLEEMEVEDELSAGANEEEETLGPRLSSMDRLTLFLGTAFSPTVLRHLMEENPFLRQFCSSMGCDNVLTLERVDELLNTQLTLMNNQIRQRLGRTRTSALLVDIRCERCWRFRKNSDELDQTEENCQCPTGNQSNLLCTVTLHHKKAENPPILLAMRRIVEEKVEEEKQSEENGRERDGVEEVGKGLATLVEQVLSMYFSDLPSSRPSLVLVHPPSFRPLPSSICSIPCLPAILPQCLQKRLLAVLSKNSEIRQMSAILAEKISNADKTDRAQLETSAGNLLLLPSTSSDGPAEASDALFVCAKIMLQHRKIAENGSEWESLRELCRLHDIITTNSQWLHFEEVEEALSAIRKERFVSLDGSAQRIAAELSKASDALKVMQHCGLINCVPRASIGPNSIFASIIEIDAHWTERNALILFNGNRRTNE
uniref:BED-type domain-containing protein n=1 Tax=Globodera rostochiensis TaxID=31243 RepID=A0A914IAM7_GLORO